MVAQPEPMPAPTCSEWIGMQGGSAGTFQTTSARRVSQLMLSLSGQVLIVLAWPIAEPSVDWLTGCGS